MNIVDNVRKNIKNILNQENITQVKLAEKLDISTVYLSRLLNGVKGEGLKISLVQDIAIALNVDICELIKNTQNSPLVKIEEDAYEPIKDERMVDIIKRLRELWLSADDDEKGHLTVEFKGFLVDYKDKKQKREAAKITDAQTA